MLLKALLLVLTAVLGLSPTHGSGRGHGHGQDGLDRPGKCRMLPASQQPKAPAGASAGGGNLVAVVPATTCNTPRSQWPGH